MSQAPADQAEQPAAGSCLSEISSGFLTLQRSGPELTVRWDTGASLDKLQATRGVELFSTSQRLQGAPPFKLRLHHNANGDTYISLEPSMVYGDYSKTPQIKITATAQVGETDKVLGSYSFQRGAEEMAIGRMRLLAFTKKHTRTVVPSVEVDARQKPLLVICTIVMLQPSRTVTFDQSPYRSLSLLYDNPSVADLVFEFPQQNGRKPKTLYAAKAILAFNSAYYKTMFESGFSESDSLPVSSKATYDERELLADDSDDEEDSFKAPNNGAADMMSIREESDTPITSHKIIPILDFTHTTYYAVLRYLYLGSISFAPLRSTYRLYCQKALESGKARPDLEAWNLANATHVNSMGDELYVASPKSVYRLAQKLDVKSLEALARKQINASINDDTALEEARSTFAQFYPDIKSEIIAYIKKNWGAIGKSPATEALWERTKNDRIWFEVMRGFA